MKKSYEEIILDILFIAEDAVRCSNTHPKGDDIETDIFD